MSEENKQPMEEQEEAIPETQAGPEQEARIKVQPRLCGWYG